MTIQVGIAYTAIATVTIDVPEIEEGAGLPDPDAVRTMMREHPPEVLRATEQHLVSIDSVIIGDEELLIDAGFE
jgi:hypothetical protein